ncbi:hypothetical protein F5Y16DRAFT_395208 [Xylariaceae sp. FL0255]|nr:hypothetical protein F5Y16DRAFT_395208 [Xylariaceae sp. FL0255]
MLSLRVSRALMFEQPSLKIFTSDNSSKDPDNEFVQNNNVVHVSRFVPDDAVNQAFRSSQGPGTVKSTLSEAGDFRLAVRQVGEPDTIHFRTSTTTP